MELLADFRSALNRKSLFRRGFVDGIGGGPSTKDSVRFIKIKQVRVYGLDFGVVSKYSPLSTNSVQITPVTNSVQILNITPYPQTHGSRSRSTTSAEAGTGSVGSSVWGLRASRPRAALSASPVGQVALVPGLRLARI